MLVLSRKVNENIVIDGRIVVKVVRTEGNFVKLGIEAPPDVPVHRQEIYDEIQKSNQAALTVGRPAPGQLRPSRDAATSPSASASSTAATAATAAPASPSPLTPGAPSPSIVNGGTPT